MVLEQNENDTNLIQFGTFNTSQRKKEKGGAGENAISKKSLSSQKPGLVDIFEMNSSLDTLTPSTHHIATFPNLPFSEGKGGCVGGEREEQGSFGTFGEAPG